MWEGHLCVCYCGLCLLDRLVVRRASVSSQRRSPVPVWSCVCVCRVHSQTQAGRLRGACTRARVHAFQNSKTWDENMAVLIREREAHACMAVLIHGAPTYSGKWSGKESSKESGKESSSQARGPLPSSACLACVGCLARIRSIAQRRRFRLLCIPFVYVCMYPCMYVCTYECNTLPWCKPRQYSIQPA